MVHFVAVVGFGCVSYVLCLRILFTFKAQYYAILAARKEAIAALVHRGLRARAFIGPLLLTSNVMPVYVVITRGTDREHPQVGTRDHMFLMTL